MSKIEVDDDLIRSVVLIMRKIMYDFLSEHINDVHTMKCTGLNGAIALFFHEIKEIMQISEMENKINFLKEINIHFQMYVDKMKEEFINKH